LAGVIFAISHHHENPCASEIPIQLAPPDHPQLAVITAPSELCALLKAIVYYLQRQPLFSPKDINASDWMTLE